jgi:para-nitrobenzyl esterase
MEEMGVRITEKLGLAEADDQLGALRAIDAEELYAGARATPDLLFATGGFRYWPAIDGWLVPDDPMALFAAGKQHDVPLLIGSNADEQAARPPTRITGAAAYEAWVRRVSRSDSHATRVLEAFPASSPEAMAHGVERIMTLSLLVTPPRIFARAMGKVPSRCYLYHFTRVPPGARGVGAYHALEIPYVFNNLATSRIARLPGRTGEYCEQADLELSKTISAYWLQFAATGDPNRDGLPTWPPYETETDHHLELGDEIKVGQGLQRELIDLFTEILTGWRAERKVD